MNTLLKTTAAILLNICTLLGDGWQILHRCISSYSRLGGLGRERLNMSILILDNPAELANTLRKRSKFLRLDFLGSVK